jgi:hypothetical protein
MASENPFWGATDSWRVAQAGYRRLRTHCVTVSDGPGVRSGTVFEVSSLAPIGRVIDDLILLAECSLAGEWEGQVRFLPL